MAHVVETHRKQANGGYVLEVRLDNGELHTFAWSSPPVDEETGKPLLTDAQYEKQQLAEAKLLIEAELDEGKKLKAEGKKL